MNPIISLLGLIITVFQIILIARVLMSWFPQLAYNSNPTVRQVMRAIYDITEPVIEPVRRMVPPTQGVDFAPMIVMVILFVIKTIFIR